MELGHRRAPAVVGLPLVLGPGCTCDQQGGGIDRHRHSGQLVPGHRIVGQHTVAKLARGREVQGFVERATGKAERGGANRDPEQVQRLHGDLETVAFVAEQLERGALRKAGGTEDVVAREAGDQDRVRRGAQRADHFAGSWRCTIPLARGSGVEGADGAGLQLEGDGRRRRRVRGGHFVDAGASGQVQRWIRSRCHQAGDDRAGVARIDFAGARLAVGRRPRPAAAVALGAAVKLIGASTAEDHVGASTAVDLLGAGAAAGFARQDDVVALRPQRLGQQPRLRRLAGPVDPFEGDEHCRALQLPTSASARLARTPNAVRSLVGKPPLAMA